jgi:hypothetical protein
MQALDAIAEQRIREAAMRGEFNDLPGAGRPLDLDDDLLVPEELRMAYRILRNAGFVPPEVQTLKEIGALERLVHTLEEGEERSQALRKLHLLTMRVSEMRGGSLQLDAGYYDTLLQRLL